MFLVYTVLVAGLTGVASLVAAAMRWPGGAGGGAGGGCDPPLHIFLLIQGVVFLFMVAFAARIYHAFSRPYAGSARYQPAASTNGPGARPGVGEAPLPAPGFAAPPGPGRGGGLTVVVIRAGLVEPGDRDAGPCRRFCFLCMCALILTLYYVNDL